MSNKRKLPKDRETTDYTVQDFVDDEVNKFGDLVKAVMAEAKEGGEHGVMIIVGETAFVSDLVPYGRVFQAGSMDAVDKLRQKLEQEK